MSALSNVLCCIYHVLLEDSGISTRRRKAGSMAHSRRVPAGYISLPRLVGGSEFQCRHLGSERR